MYGVVALKPLHFGEDREYTRLEISRELSFDSFSEAEKAINRIFYFSDNQNPIMSDGSMVYWNIHSHYRRGKVYLKYPFMIHQSKLSRFNHSQDEIDKSAGVLCCDLTLYRRYWQKTLGVNDWRQLTPAAINAEWHKYFNPLIGAISHG
jgi:hypothetical protein